MNMKLYLAGPMTGIAHYNFPAFDDAAAQLRDAGYEVVNPTEMDREEGFDPVKNPEIVCTPEMYQRFMEKDKKALETCDGIALLPGWENSPGVLEEIRHFAITHPTGFAHMVSWWVDNAPLLVGYNPENIDIKTLLSAPKGSRLLESDTERLAFSNLNTKHHNLWLSAGGQWFSGCWCQEGVTYVTTRPRGWWRTEKADAR